MGAERRHRHQPRSRRLWSGTARRSFAPPPWRSRGRSFGSSAPAGRPCATPACRLLLRLVLWLAPSWLVLRLVLWLAPSWLLALACPTCAATAPGRAALGSARRRRVRTGLCQATPRPRLPCRGV
ncbi:hypothetical protein D1007_45455 [Hordeum vulgare]|nr:hypothetical protein D1007_45455 [Hordeum vulgare]